MLCNCPSQACCQSVCRAAFAVLVILAFNVNMDLLLSRYRDQRDRTDLGNPESHTLYLEMRFEQLRVNLFASQCVSKLRPSFLLGHTYQQASGFADGENWGCQNRQTIALSVFSTNPKVFLNEVCDVSILLAVFFRPFESYSVHGDHARLKSRERRFLVGIYIERVALATYYFL